MAPLALSFHSLSRPQSERRRLSKARPSNIKAHAYAPAPLTSPSSESVYREDSVHSVGASIEPPTPPLEAHIDHVNYSQPLYNRSFLQQDPFRSPSLGPRYDADSRAPSILQGYDQLTPRPSRPASTYSPGSSQLDLSRSDEHLPLNVESPPRLSIWARFKAGFQRQFDWRGFLQLLDCRPWFWPFTWKKYLGKHPQTVSSNRTRSLRQKKSIHESTKNC